MVIYKFGGASVKNAESFGHLKEIVAGCDSKLIVVVSAMGKTTNHLEQIVKLAAEGSPELDENIAGLKLFHEGIINSLVPDTRDSIYESVREQFKELIIRINRYRNDDFNLFYDQVVSMGEILSTLIVSRYLSNEGIVNKWMDIREFLITDDNYRDATIDKEETLRRMKAAFDLDKNKCLVTQGFIGSSPNGNSTTLGREGSDFSASVLAEIFDAESVTLWKDVEGIYSADPARFSQVSLLEKISYQEMIELAYYGAKVVHPKAIKPLREKQIPLYVKSFYHPGKNGSMISEAGEERRKTPITIIKEDQVLVSISLGDLSFISEYHISRLFSLLNRFRLKANLIQHSAVSFSVCVDEPRGREVQDLIGILRKEFRVLYNDKLTLATIRHYTQEHIDEIIKGQKIYVEQRSRNTVQFLIS